MFKKNNNNSKKSFQSGNRGEGRGDQRGFKPNFQKEFNSENRGEGRGDQRGFKPGFQKGFNSENRGEGRGDQRGFKPNFQKGFNSENRGEGRGDQRGFKPGFQKGFKSENRGEGRGDQRGFKPGFQKGFNSENRGEGRGDQRSFKPNFQKGFSSENRGEGRGDQRGFKPGFQKGFKSENRGEGRDDQRGFKPGFQKGFSSENRGEGRGDQRGFKPGFQKGFNSENRGEGRGDQRGFKPGFQKGFNSENRGEGRGDQRGFKPNFQKGKHAKSFGSSINKKGSSQIEKNNLPIKIPLEYVLKYIKEKTFINTDSMSAELPVEGKDIFLSKINLLLKRKILTTEDNVIFKLNEEEISEGIQRFSYLTIKSHLVKDHYLTNITNLSENIYSEEDLIINNLKENLKDRKILAEIILEEEKIIANPIFYLDEYNLKKPNQPAEKLSQNNIIKGIYQNYNGEDVLIPIDFKSKSNIHLKGLSPAVKSGSLVSAKLLNPNTDDREAIFISELATSSATSCSMLSVYQYNLRHEFSEEILQKSNLFKEVDLGKRVDITHLPLVTIDDEDAKDFDDAIFAEKISENTYKIYVAIADVAHYVKPNDSLDLEAQLRGNSVYLPGFVIPMLPKELSNGWCSLNPNENRGCLVMEGIINRNGELESFKFYRGLMKSHARLTYKEVNEVLSEQKQEVVSNNGESLVEKVIIPLKEAYLLLDKAKKKRNAVEIHSKEIKVILDKNENVLDIKVRESLISHKIVEEFMISANVAVAKFFEQNGLSKKGLAVYRVHAKPSLEKLYNLQGILKSLRIDKKIPDTLTGSFFNTLLSEYSSDNIFNTLNETILRTQSQAEYSNNNIGHFGLALHEYCHFTSPIRRYADLMVHRLLLSILEQEEYSYSAIDVENISKTISLTERLAFNAENVAKSRILAKWLSSRIGESFEAEISSITNAGIFVNLLDCGATGLVPMRTISRSFVQFDASKHKIIDKNKHREFNLGKKISVILKEADEIRGLLTFLIDEDKMPNSRRR